MKIKTLPMLVSIVCLPTLAEQRAPVEEFEVPSRNEAAQAQTVAESTAATNPQVEMYYQLQVLQEEIRRMRGALDEANYEIQQIKQRQMDDYLDLDRRVSGLQKNGVAASAATIVTQNATGKITSPAATTPTKSVALPVSGDAEKDNYSAAYLLLREKKIAESIVAFNAYIANYPNGKYVANAYYWLGETNALTGNLVEAQKFFAMVVDKYPLNRKSEDAALGLSKVYFQQGETTKAKVLLEKIALGTSRAATKAKTFLQDNF